MADVDCHLMRHDCYKLPVKKKHQVLVVHFTCDTYCKINYNHYHCAIACEALHVEFCVMYSIEMF